MIRTIAVTGLITIASAQNVIACPYCNSEIGQDVAAGIFNEDFAPWH